MNDFSLNNKALFIDFDSTFVKVETIDELARFSLADDPDAEYKVRMITYITNQAMCGEIDFPDALEKRLEILSVTKEDIKNITHHISGLVSYSFVKSRELIRSLSDSIWIVSGGFREIICPIVADFGIGDDHILANSFIYSGEQVIGCDRDGDLFKKGGKIKAIRDLNLDREIFMIGDGFTDYEVHSEGIAKAFICYTENISRERVLEVSDYSAESFSQALEIIKKI